MRLRRYFDSNTSSEQGEMPSAAAPLEDDDLLSEILLLLPPLPSSLPRASLVCKRWHRVVSDPGFVRRFRFHHRRRSPLLGFFANGHCDVSFLPALDAPNRLPSGLLSRKLDCSDGFWSLDCRHGLVLVFLRGQNQVLVWDSVSDDQHRIAVHLGFDMNAINGAVVRTTGLVQHFQVVLVGHDEERWAQALACVYSSKTGAWGNLISTPLPPEDSTNSRRVVRDLPPVLVGDSLYWLLSESILQFDLGRQALTVVTMPPVNLHAGRESSYYFSHYNTHFRVMRAEGDGLGFLFLSGFDVQLWKRNTNSDGVASWMLERTFELDKLLPLTSTKGREYLWILGFAEDNNVVLLVSKSSMFTVQLQSLQWKLIDGYKWHQYLPFESVYTASNAP